MFTSNYKFVEIIAPEKRYLALLQEWFDGLDDGEVKDAICRIRWRELNPKVSWFRLMVYCWHQRPQDIEAFIKAKQQDDVSVIEEAATKVLKHFDRWIEASGVPQETVLDERSARITWLAEGITYHDPETYSPQEKAQYEINRQASMFLWLVHLSAQPEAELLKYLVGSNIPFASAGLMLTGHVRLVRGFPPDFPDSDAERERLHASLWEHPADFIILMRLAHHFDCRQEIVTRVQAARDRFLLDNAKLLPDWLMEYERSEAEEDDPLCSTEPVLAPDFYESLDEACEKYRQELQEAVEGREQEIGEALNSFLEDLPKPHGPIADRLWDEGEWWKRGEE